MVRELLNENIMATTLELLQLLGKAWVVTLAGPARINRECPDHVGAGQLDAADQDQWQLRIESHPAPRWDEYFSYTYRGSLASVVARAYAGEPDDGPAQEVAA